MGWRKSRVSEDMTGGDVGMYCPPSHERHQTRRIHVRNHVPTEPAPRACTITFVGRSFSHGQAR